MRCLFESVHHDYSKRCRIINAWHAEGVQWTLTGRVTLTLNIVPYILPNTTVASCAACACTGYLPQAQMRE